MESVTNLPPEENTNIPLAITITPQQKIQYYLINITAGILVVVLGLSWILYPEKYAFWQNYISHLGGIRTPAPELTLNTTSRYIFSIGLWICMGLSIGMGVLYLRPKYWSLLNGVKSVFLWFMAFGAFFTGMPHDGQFALMHRIGAAVFFLSFDFYVFICQFMRFRNRKITLDTQESKKITPDKYFVFILFGITITYMLLIAIQIVKLLPVFQKLTVICFIIGVIMLDKEDM